MTRKTALEEELKKLEEEPEAGLDLDEEIAQLVFGGQIAGFPCLVCVSHDPANVPGGAKYWHFRHIRGLVRIVLGFVLSKQSGRSNNDRQVTPKLAKNISCL